MKQRLLCGATVAAVAFTGFAGGYFSGSDTTQVNRIIHPKYMGGTARQWANHEAFWKALARQQKKTTKKLLRTNEKAIAAYTDCVNTDAGC